MGERDAGRIGDGTGAVMQSGAHVRSCDMRPRLTFHCVSRRPSISSGAEYS
jgi:hypothetical protein